MIPSLIRSQAMMMAVLLLSVLTSHHCCKAFSVNANSKNIRPDTSALVEEALKITATFGIDSKEAAVAWDNVEEADASDNSAATLPSLADECSVVETQASPQCQEYGRFLDELSLLRETFSSNDSSNKKTSLVDTLKMVKLSEPTAAKATTSKQLEEALAAAKAATAEHGVTSTQARLAWETYEEIASTGYENAVGVNLVEECSLESAQEACQAMEELERVLPVLLAVSNAVAKK